VLRRFENEAVEIVCLELPAVAPALVASPGCQVTGYADGDTQVYRVALATGYAVRPVDWRRFATDELKVRAMLTRCVRDNLAEAVFEPWSPALADRFVPRLTLALQDLSSMLEVIHVQLEPGDGPDALRVSVELRNVGGRAATVVLVLSGDAPAVSN
jgi:hypothetical protein